jgi:hypothetical protein
MFSKEEQARDLILIRLLLAHGRWFSPGTLTSSTTKTGRIAIAEILLKVALNTNNQIQNPKVTHVRREPMSYW